MKLKQSLEIEDKYYFYYIIIRNIKEIESINKTFDINNSYFHFYAKDDSSGICSFLSIESNIEEENIYENPFSISYTKRYSKQRNDSIENSLKERTIKEIISQNKNWMFLLFAGNDCYPSEQKCY